MILFLEMIVTSTASKELFVVAVGIGAACRRSVSGLSWPTLGAPYGVNYHARP